MTKFDFASEFPTRQPLQVPIEYYADDDGRPVIVSGGRRVAALKARAAAGTPGFTADMPILAIEVAKPTDNQQSPTTQLRTDLPAG